ncbi:hypothetical protein NQ315_013347 [Exocentrus adspersus]|uniref:Uncharacterized protein n=1 Tax=Exocentrus adspersus TaxID=1586481 RepID=A0AAV8VRW9_9CUCU|nr:hypothetical protein NQ315_013347 [Exocentrus adspersus]
MFDRAEAAVKLQKTIIFRNQQLAIRKVSRLSRSVEEERFWSEGIQKFGEWAFLLHGLIYGISSKAIWIARESE